jgi:hypothetical protein
MSQTNLVGHGIRNHFCRAWAISLITLERDNNLNGNWLNWNWFVGAQHRCALLMNWIGL